MKHWKPWTLAAAALCVATLAVLWRLYSPLPYLYTWYVSEKTEEAIFLLETDPTLYNKDTQDAVRLVAAAAAKGFLHSPETRYVLAVQYEREGNYEEAKEILHGVIQSADGWSWPYVALGILLARSGEGHLEEAEKLLRRAVELQPDWVRPYNSLSVVLRLLGRLEEAEATSLQAIELAPYDVAAHNNYANLLVLQARYEEAETHYRFAMESEPFNAKPPYNLACLFSIIGAYEEACDYLEAAVALSESSRTDAAMDPYFDSMRTYPRFQEILYGEVLTPVSDAWADEGEAPPEESDADETTGEAIPGNAGQAGPESGNMPGKAREEAPSAVDEVNASEDETTSVRPVEGETPSESL